VRPAARTASRVTLVYLVVTLPLLLRGPWGARQATVALLHVAAIGGLWWSLRSTGKVADWLPMLLVPFLYGELPYLIGAGASYRDPLVQRWEAALFGGQPARTLAGDVPIAPVSEVLHLGYLLYYPIVYVPPLVLYVTGRRAEFGRTVLAVMATYAVCYAVFVVFPVEGPRYAWGAPASAPAGPFRSLTLAILERGSSRGTAFPSSHAAVAAAQTVVTLRFQPGLGIAVVVTSALLMVGAVYGGFHYAVDVLVGAGVGTIIAAAVSTRPMRA
jgi:membrane-associated phospholipid phosphatase